MVTWRPPILLAWSVSKRPISGDSYPGLALSRARKQFTLTTWLLVTLLISRPRDTQCRIYADAQCCRVALATWRHRPPFSSLLNPIPCRFGCALLVQRTFLSFLISPAPPSPPLAPPAPPQTSITSLTLVPSMLLLMPASASASTSTSDFSSTSSYAVATATTATTSLYLLHTNAI